MLNQAIHKLEDCQILRLIKVYSRKHTTYFIVSLVTLCYSFYCYSLLLPILVSPGGFNGFSKAALERKRDKEKHKRQSEGEREFLLMKVTVTLGLLPSQTHTSTATCSLTQ